MTRGMRDIGEMPRGTVLQGRRLATVRGRLTGRERAGVAAMASTVVGLTVAGLTMLMMAAPHHYHLGNKAVFGIGTGVLAYTLGMRHAFDADHIAAIDNTTRRLMAEGKRPLSVGFWFSLGHSSVVFALAALLNLGIRALGSQVAHPGSGLHHLTGIVGTAVSGAFLYVLAALNVVVLVSIVRAFVGLRRGTYDEGSIEALLDQRGLLNRILRPVARRIDVPWKMYPVGVLFGLGFDTATEIALLVLSGTAVGTGLPFWAVLSLPVLFAAGMSLFDTLDGCFMNFAYGWAFSRPVRKLYFNLTITGLSVLVAFVVGTIEIGGLVAGEAGLNGRFWSWMQGFNLNAAGFAIVGVFAAVWVVALAVWRFGRVEARWEAAAASSRQHLGIGRDPVGAADELVGD